VSGTTPDSQLAVRPERTAGMLDISRAKLYQLIARGELPSFTIDNSRRILVADIHKYAAERLSAELAAQASGSGTAA
jgi:hypothetical protein